MSIFRSVVLRFFFDLFAQLDVYWYRFPRQCVVNVGICSRSLETSFLYTVNLALSEYQFLAAFDGEIIEVIENYLFLILFRFSFL